MNDAIRLYGKIQKCKFIIKLTAVCAVAAMTVYTLIPKSEKIKGVSEEGFLNAECRVQSAE